MGFWSSNEITKYTAGVLLLAVSLKKSNVSTLLFGGVQSTELLNPRFNWGVRSMALINRFSSKALTAEAPDVVKPPGVGYGRPKDRD